MTAGYFSNGERRFLRFQERQPEFRRDAPGGRAESGEWKRPRYSFEQYRELQDRGRNLQDRAKNVQLKILSKVRGLEEEKKSLTMGSKRSIELGRERVALLELLSSLTGKYRALAEEFSHLRLDDADGMLLANFRETLNEREDLLKRLDQELGYFETKAGIESPKAEKNIEPPRDLDPFGSVVEPEHEPGGYKNPEGKTQYKDPETGEWVEGAKPIENPRTPVSAPRKRVRTPKTTPLTSIRSEKPMKEPRPKTKKPERSRKAPASVPKDAAKPRPSVAPKIVPAKPKRVATPTAAPKPSPKTSAAPPVTPVAPKPKLDVPKSPTTPEVKTPAPKAAPALAPSVAKPSPDVPAAKKPDEPKAPAALSKPAPAPKATPTPTPVPAMKPDVPSPAPAMAPEPEKKPSIPEKPPSKPSPAPSVIPTPPAKPDLKEGAEKKPEADPKTPESVEDVNEIEKEHLHLLNSYRLLSEEQLLKRITPEEIDKREKDGTLYVLLMAIESKDKNNQVETSDDPEHYYKAIIANVIREGMELKAEIKSADALSIEEIKDRLMSPPLSEYFKQEKLPAMDLQFDQLSQEQLRTLYESCLLEKKIRAANIQYTQNGPFWSAAIPNKKFKFFRQGDCNTIASYYLAMSSVSGSERLSTSLKIVTVDGHTQICFDIGKDMGGKQLRISKNTSYVDPSLIDNNGRWKKPGYQYAHNFYDFEHDIDFHGADENRILDGAHAVVATQIAEIRMRDLSSLSDQELLREKNLSEKIRSLNPYDTTANSNSLAIIWTMLDKQLLSKQDAQTEVEQVLDKDIEASYISGFSLLEFSRRFGKKAAEKYVQKYEEKLLRNPDSFTRFIRSAVQTMRDIPAYDRRISAVENTISIDIENRRNMCRSLSALPFSQQAKQLINKEFWFLDAEIRRWIPLS